MRACPAAVARLIAAPRSTAVRVSGGPECLPGFAQQLLSAARRADTLGGGQVPGLCQHLG
jgi:hypothetical protein